MVNSENNKALQQAGLQIVNDRDLHEGVVLIPIAKNAFIDSPEADATLWFIAHQEDVFTILRLIAIKLKETSVMNMMESRLNTIQTLSKREGVHIDRIASILFKEQSYYGREIDRDLDKVAKLSANLIILHLKDCIE